MVCSLKYSDLFSFLFFFLLFILIISLYNYYNTLHLIIPTFKPPRALLPFTYSLNFKTSQVGFGLTWAWVWADWILHGYRCVCVCVSSQASLTIVLAIARYSASVLEQEIVCFFFAHQDMKLLPKKM